MDSNPPPPLTHTHYWLLNKTAKIKLICGQNISVDEWNIADVIQLFHPCYVGLVCCFSWCLVGYLCNNNSHSLLPSVPWAWEKASFWLGSSGGVLGRHKFKTDWILWSKGSVWFTLRWSLCLWRRSGLTGSLGIHSGNLLKLFNQGRGKRLKNCT